LPPRAVLFDLDGTLVQTREASWAVFQETNRAFSLGVDTQDAYFALMQDNLFAALRRLCRDEPMADAVTRHFLERLQAGYFPPLVPGMSDVVRSLAGTCALAVISSNATAVIRRILVGARLQHCFSHVFGGDVEPDKRASVRRFLTDEAYAVGRACRPDYREDARPALPTGEEVVLVTDTVGDVRHAKECGIRAVGVAWGMHTEADLLAAGAEFVALWPQEVAAHLLPGGFAAASGACAIGTPYGAAAPSPCSCDGACACAGNCTCSTPEKAASESRRVRALQAAAALADGMAAPSGTAGENALGRSMPSRTVPAPSTPEGEKPGPAAGRDAALVLAALGRLRRGRQGEAARA